MSPDEILIPNSSWHVLKRSKKPNVVLSLCRHLVRGGRSRPEELGPLSSRHSVRSPLGAPGSPCRLGLPAPAPGAPPHCTVGGRRARAAGARCEGSSRRLASCASGPPLLSKVALLPAGGLTPPRASERALEPQPVPGPAGRRVLGAERHPHPRRLAATTAIPDAHLPGPGAQVGEDDFSSVPAGGREEGY